MSPIDFGDDLSDRVHHLWAGGRHVHEIDDEGEEDEVYKPFGLCNEDDCDEDVYVADRTMVTCEKCKDAMARGEEPTQ